MANNPIQALLHAIAKAWFMITFVFGLAFAATATRLAHLLIFLNQTQREKLSARLGGHFTVYFKSEAKAGDFSVDKDAQEKVTQAIDEHVKEGGGLSFFPEGQINRIDSKVLQPFRRGAFESFAKKHAMRMYAFLH